MASDSPDISRHAVVGGGLFADAACLAAGARHIRGRAAAGPPPVRSGALRQVAVGPIDLASSRKGARGFHFNRTVTGLGEEPLPVRFQGG